jgi:CheY-like chemotaxis protein
MVSQLTHDDYAPAVDPLSVLIVEDERTARRAMHALLSNCGYRPRAFGSAEDALSFLSSGSFPNIALIDLDLPGMNGLELIGRLKQLDPAIFPILITATDESSLAARLRGHSIAYMQKPLSFEKLLGMLAQSPAHSPHPLDPPEFFR